MSILAFIFRSWHSWQSKKFFCKWLLWMTLLLFSLCYGAYRASAFNETTFCLFSAHKRFTELLTRDEKDLPNIRVPMDRILSLPELKVRSNETAYDQNYGSVWFIKGPSNKDSVYPECPALCVFWRECFNHWWIAVTLVFVPVIVQPFQKKNLPCVLDIGTERWKPHIWRLFGPLECIQWLGYSGNQIPLCIPHIW